jgi:two-component system LytT family response regulator
MEKEKITAIIIDDEPDAINLLSLYLRHYPEIIVIGKETNAINGLKLVSENLPDLVFLDIDMPDMNGLQVANHIQSENFHSEIVFTTAYQNYAYDAMGVEPLDFLIKPYCVEDLEIVIQKFRVKSEQKKMDLKMAQFIVSQSNLPKLKLPANHGVVMVDLKYIVIMKSQGNKCSIHLQDGTVETINKNLGEMVELINSDVFFRLGRSTYINLNYLTRIDKKNNKCFLRFNQLIHEENITREQVLYFEKMNLFTHGNG